MATPTPCPEPSRLHELLAGSLPAGDLEALTGHLDGCADCQQRLEEMTGGTVVRRPPRPGATPAPGPAYWPAVRELQRDDLEPTRLDVAGLAGRPLPFLAPSDDSTHLGRLDHFEVVEVIGRGGMGVVLKARDACLQRFVAIKVLAPELADNETARQRFCREARAAAAVSHDHVVGIYAVEESDGLPYLVMPYVAGGSLQDRLDRGERFAFPEALRVAAEAAAGLAAAHEKGLIHRDIKPANILLEEGSGRVKLTDFGLARAAEDVKLTQTGFVAGTPLYMAPEQARGEPLDHRADLFSLGSVLYTLCTGRAPFDGSTPFVVLRAVTEGTPRPVREVNPDVPEWFAEVVERLHAKGPDDRFQSAAEVAEILAARLAEIRPASRVLVPTGNTSGARRARRGRRPFWVLGAGATFLLVGGLAVTEGTGATRLVARLFRPGSLHPARATLDHQGPVWSVAFSPDDGLLAAAIDDGNVRLWEPATGWVRGTLPAHKAPVWAVAFCPTGRRVATASDDATVKIWDVETGQELLTLPHTNAVRAAAFSPDGRLLATGGRAGAVRVWGSKSGKEVITTKGHEGVVMAVAFSPDGKTLASGGGDKVAKLWDAATGREQVALAGHVGAVLSLAFSPDGTQLATGGWDKTVRLWDTATGKELRQFRGHTQDIWSVAFCPTGRRIASGSEDRTVKVWDFASGKDCVTLEGHTGTVYAVRFSHDGKTLASGGRDGSVKLWDVSR
jgi:eukaryotic-like serine/threonine-protein kinase